jgi:phosphocarrier protein FPr/phosphocarrier protein
MGSPGRLEIVAPLSGALVPLEAVPDPVFSRRMAGDGISLDPTSGELLAPVDGTVTLLHRAHHALTITTEHGIEVLVHIGVDTVALGGAGFAPKVQQGDRVTVGQVLITFDVDRVAREARSLLTQVLVANVERVARFVPATGLVVAGKSVALTLELRSPVTAAGPVHGDAQLGDEVSLPNRFGLHARPAAVLAALAKRFTSELRVVRGADEANAKSLVAILALATKRGDAVRIKATGPDAAEAVRALSEALSAGCGEAASEAPSAPDVDAPEARAAARSPLELAGVSASPGLAVGHVVQHRQEVIEVAEVGDTPARERGKLDAALRDARAEIEALKGQLKDAQRAQILDAHQELLADPDLVEAAILTIGDGKSAAFAWRAAFARSAGRLEGLGNALLRERANDIRDVGRRVLGPLAGVARAALVVPPGSILIAEELTPSDMASVDRSKLLGLCTTTGGATSHVAILARSFGIPAVCAIDEGALLLPPGMLVVLDGTRGLLHRDPSEAEVAVARERVARQAQKRSEETAGAAAPAVTTDGHRVEVAANVRNAAEAREGVANGAEGVGLLRSEFLFDDRASAPDEDEQAAAYLEVADAVGPGRTLVVRTLDVGGDKPLPYLPMPREDNPFLGLRGVRVSLDQPAMFRAQLRAILRAAPRARLHVMFPMIATLEELREAKALLAEEQAATGHADVRVGLMIEVPSAAVMAEQLAREADFFSIGTNDLTQYTLAMDRGHPKLAKKADGLHPSVLQMIALTCAGAKAHGRWVGVCGGLASDTMAVPVLLGLGVDELSASVPAIPAIKALIRRLALADCQRLATDVLRLGTAAEVRARLAAFAG